MEVAPGSVELAGVPQAIEPKVPGVPYGHRKMNVAPFAARQALQLKMAVRASNRPVARPDVPRVVKYGAIRIPRSNKPRHLLLELVDCLKAELLSSHVTTGFQARLQHLFAAITTRAGNGLDNIEEQPVRR